MLQAQLAAAAVQQKTQQRLQRARAVLVNAARLAFFSAEPEQCNCSLLLATSDSSPIPILALSKRRLYLYCTQSLGNATSHTLP